MKRHAHQNRRLVTSVLSITLTCSPAAAQEPSRPAAIVLERSDVRLVEIEIRAVDGQGAPVVDLTAADLDLRIDGQPTAVVHLGSARLAPEERSLGRGGAGMEAAGIATGNEADDVLSLAILLDDSHLGPSGRRRALHSLAEFVRHQAPPGTRFLLATHDGTLAVRAPWTASPEKLVEALERLPLASLTGMTRERDRAFVLDTIRLRHEVALQTPEEDCPKDLEEIARGHAEQEFLAARGSFDAIGLLAESLGSLPGRRAMLIVTDGVPLESGLEAYQYLEVLCGGAGARQGIENAIDVKAQGGGFAAGTYDSSAAALDRQRFHAGRWLEEARRRAQRASVPIFTLQASPPSAGAGSSAETAQRQTLPEMELATTQNVIDAAALLADETGGRVWRQRATLGESFAEAGRRLANAYRLGFYPTVAGDDRPHRVRLATRRPGVRLEYSTSFVDRSPDVLAAQLVLAALLHEEARDSFGLSFGPVAEFSPVTHKPALRLQIPFSSLTWIEQGGGRHAMITVFVAFLSSDGAVTPTRRRTQPLALPLGADTAQGSHLYEIGLDLAPGDHVAAVAVRDEFGNVTAVRRGPLRVPPADGPSANP